MDYRYHDAITALLAELDPEGLIADGAPADEYEDEAFALCSLVYQQSLTPGAIRNVWQTSFHATATAYLTEDDPQLLSLYLSILSVVNSPPPAYSPSPRDPLVDPSL